MDTYDAGLLNDYGGGDVGWWQDYLRAELGRAEDFYRGQHARIVTEKDARIAELEKALETARRDAFEEAAKVADAARDEWPSRASDYACGAADYSGKIATAIRALAEKG